MASWQGVSDFLDRLGEPPSGIGFDAWFNDVWRPFEYNSRGAAAHIWVVSTAVADARSLDELRDNLYANALECGFIPEEFVQYAWERAVRQFENVNDGE